MLAKNNRGASLAGWWQPPLSSCQSWSLILIPALQLCELTEGHIFRCMKIPKVEDGSNKLLNMQLGIYLYHQAPQSLQKSPPKFLMQLPTQKMGAPLHRTLSLWGLIILLPSGGFFFGPILSFFETQPSWVAVAWRDPAKCSRAVLRLWGLCWTAGEYVGMTSWSGVDRQLAFKKEK